MIPHGPVSKTGLSQKPCFKHDKIHELAQASIAAVSIITAVMVVTDSTITISIIIARPGQDRAAFWEWHQ